MPRRHRTAVLVLAVTMIIGVAPASASPGGDPGFSPSTPQSVACAIGGLGPAGDPNVRWEADGAGYPLTVTNGVLFVARADATVAALDAASGKGLWRVDLAGNLAGAPAVAGGAIYVGAWDGTLYRLHA